MRRKFHLFKRNVAKRHGRRLRLIKQMSLHPVAVPVLTFAFLFMVSGVAYAAFTQGESRPDARVVIISHDNVEQTIPSTEPTVGALLQKLDIKLADGDVVEPAQNTKINQDDFRVNIYRALPVQIVDGDNKVMTYSAAKTPRAVANQTGSELYAEDRVVAQPIQNFVTQEAIGEQVIIDRAMPVNVNLYGTPETIRTHAKTVGDLMEEKGIKLEGSDQVSPAADTPLAANTQVFIVREGIKLESVTEAIPMPVQTITDTNLAYGTSAVRQQGSAGQRVVTYQAQLRNGIEVGRTVIQNVVTQEPVPQIVAQGSSLSGIKGDMARAGIAASDFNYVDFIVTKESRWNPTARNASSGAYGLCQALPGSKMASAGSDWSTNPVTQLKWCDGYAKGRYGSWSAAYNFWRNNNWW